MGELLGKTESLCPVCLRRIPARRVADNGNVYLEKTCPQHGDYRVVIWREDAKHYLDWTKVSERGAGPLRSFAAVDEGCPYDCGLCPEHLTRTCTMVMEVTLRCNLHCPVCFASSGKSAENEPDIDAIRGMYDVVMEGVGACTIQISGGEPTIRDDLPQIVTLGRHAGFNHILINTNGVKIAREQGYLKHLKESGISAIYLQFDGVTDTVYRSIRGQNLLDIKKRVLDNCAREQVGVILVPTIVRGVNDHQLGGIVQFAKSWIPTVKGIHFQPVSYFGRYPHPPGDEDRMTIPDVLDALDRQTKGELRPENFVPSRCGGSHCSFSSLFVLREDGRLRATTSRLAEELVSTWGGYKKAPEESARSFMNLHWRFSEEEPAQCNTDCCGTSAKPRLGSWNDLYRQVATYGLTVTCMPFQDVWNLDLERLQRCCGHVVTPGRRIIPFCAYYLTSSSGERLYPGSLVETKLPQ